MSNIYNNTHLSVKFCKYILQKEQPLKITIKRL